VESSGKAGPEAERFRPFLFVRPFSGIIVAMGKKAKRVTTKGTPASIALTETLAKELKKHDVENPLYRQRWGERVSRGGRVIPAVIASPVKGTGYVGWPTPLARDWKGPSVQGAWARPSNGSKNACGPIAKRLATESRTQSAGSWAFRQSGMSAHSALRRRMCAPCEPARGTSLRRRRPIQDSSRIPANTNRTRQSRGLTVIGCAHARKFESVLRTPPWHTHGIQKATLIVFMCFVALYFQ
jgi:hypothetical protein